MKFINLKIMKHIKRHFHQEIYIKGISHNVGITIVGDTKKLPDGTIELKFGASRCGFKDKFIKKVGMQLATERYETKPHTERLFPGRYSFNLIIEDFINHIAYNGEYIRIHFKTK